MAVKAKATVLSLFFLAALISREDGGICGGAVEYQVTVDNTCSCPQAGVTVRCLGLSSVEPVDTAKISVVDGEHCLIAGGGAIARGAPVSFTYAWKTPQDFAVKRVSVRNEQFSIAGTALTAVEKMINIPWISNRPLVGDYLRDAVDLLRVAQVQRVPLIITVNSTGCVIETIYLAVYLFYAPKKAKLFTAKLLLLVNVGVFGLTLLLSSCNRRVVVLGWVCVCFPVSVFVAPLSIIRLVVRTKSVEFSLSLSLTASAVVWFLYGLLINDRYVALPNELDFTFGVVQMGRYAMYRK
ncbi:hypothetical protein ABZP36_009589 [Zizania latifolia]